jgi:Mitochondrial carrier protein
LFRCEYATTDDVQSKDTGMDNTHTAKNGFTSSPDESSTTSTSRHEIAETAGLAVTHARLAQGESRDPNYLYSSLMAGLASGTVSSIVCAPLDLVRTRMQVWGVVADQGSTSINGANTKKSRHLVVQIFRDILQKEGIAGCFRGLTATLLTVPVFWGVYCECV